MDDSEKSYGYSEDIYHGRRAEKSYEYGPEGETADAEGSELSPEEEAMRVQGPRSEEPTPAPDAPVYDYGRDAASSEVESFTWSVTETQAGSSRKPENPPEAEEAVGAVTRKERR